MNNGRMMDVLIEEELRANSDELNCLIVWADPEMKDIISSIEGISKVIVSSEKCKYLVYLDPRYDVKWIKAEIEAQIKINMKIPENECNSVFGELK